MFEKIKRLCLLTSHIIVWTIRITVIGIPTMVGFGVVIWYSFLSSVYFSQKFDKVILGVKLPSPATNVHYEVAGGLAPQSALCANISKNDFLTVIKELSSKGNPIKKSELKGDWSEYDKYLEAPMSRTRMLDLSCWESTNPNNEDTYFWRDRLFWRYIRYEDGKIFVVRSYL